MRPLKVNFGVHDLFIEVKMEVTQKLIYVMWDVFLYVIGARESIFVVKNDVRDLLRSILRCMTSQMEVKMEVTWKTQIYVMWDVFLYVIGAKETKFIENMVLPDLSRSILECMTF